MVIKGGLRFCYTYLDFWYKVQFNNLFNSNQIILVQPVNCCSYYTNIVSNTIQANIPPFICMLLYSNKNYFLTKYCVGCGSIQMCVLTIQIESSIYKSVR